MSPNSVRESSEPFLIRLGSLSYWIGSSFSLLITHSLLPTLIHPFD